jgi:hypothetical protein
MDKKTAIKVLETQRNKMVSNPDNIYEESWVVQTKSYIRSIFSEESPEWESIQYLYNKQRQGQPYLTRGHEEGVAKERKEWVKFLDAFIETLNHRGTAPVSLVPRKGFVEGFENAQLRKWGASIFVFALLVGYIFGAYNNPANFINKLIKAKIEGAAK